MSKDIQINDSAFEGFDEYVEEALKGFKVPGMAIAIIKDDQVIHSKGYGFRNVEKNLPVDSETVFAIGSSSKAFTTMAMSILVDQGKLNWETPVREYLPTFKLYDPIATERMTPKDLVCHRSGLPRHDLMWYNSSFTRKEIFDRMQYLEPNKDFRAAWQYQNLMFMTAGYLVEAVSGLTWEEFTAQEVFQKINMGRSNFSVDESKELDNYSLPYQEEDDEVKEIPFRNINTIGPAGSINSCLSDMSNWVKLHLNGAVDDVDVVSRAQLTEMHQPAMVMPPGFMNLDSNKEFGEMSYGLGWFMQSYRGHKVVHHGGNIDGFSAFVSLVPEENLGAVVLTNLNGNMAILSTTFNMYDRLLGFEPVDWNKKFLEEVAKMKEATEKKGEQTASKKVEGTKPSHALEAYAGDFEHPGYGLLKVTKEEGGLKAVYNSLDMALEHYHYDIFEAVPEEMKDNRMPVYFHTDFQGNIGSLSIPFEANVKDIEFTRIADQSMKEKSFLEQFVGKFEVMEKEAIVSLKGEDTLVLAVPSMPEFELEPYQGTEFYVKDMDIVRVEFKLGAEQKVIGFDLNQPGAVFTAKKIA